jgi:hypothetical protein
MDMPNDDPPGEVKPLPCPSIYATDVSISTFPLDAMVVFLQRKALAPPAGRAEFGNVTMLPVVEIHMSLESFKLFTRSAAQNLQVYEQKHGEISLGTDASPIPTGTLQ